MPERQFVPEWKYLRLLALSAFLTLPALFAGCAASPSPRIKIQSASVIEHTDHAATIAIALALENATDQPMELLEFRYDVNSDDDTAYRGTRAAQITLAERSTRTIEIPAVLVRGAGREIEPEDIRIDGSLRYLLPGTFAQTLFDVGVRRPSVSFGGSVRLQSGPASDMPRGKADDDAGASGAPIK